MDALLQSGLLQTALWVGLIGFLILRFEEAIRHDLLPRFAGVGFMGVRLDLAQRIVDDGLTKPDVQVPAGASRLLLDQLKGTGDVLRESSVLWLDDHLVRTSVERRFLTRLGIWVETVTTTTEAIEALKWARYDLVVSDMQRDDEQPTPQIALVAAKQLHGTPVIYYVGMVDRSRPVPDGAIAIVDRPDELYGQILGALRATRPGH